MSALERRDYFCRYQTHCRSRPMGSVQCSAYFHKGRVESCPYSFENLENVLGQISPVIRSGGDSSGVGICEIFTPIDGLEVMLSHVFEIRLRRQSIGSHDVLEVV